MQFIAFAGESWLAFAETPCILVAQMRNYFVFINDFSFEQILQMLLEPCENWVRIKQSWLVNAIKKCSFALCSITLVIYIIFLFLLSMPRILKDLEEHLAYPVAHVHFWCTSASKQKCNKAYARTYDFLVYVFLAIYKTKHRAKWQQKALIITVIWYPIFYLHHIL